MLQSRASQSRRHSPGVTTVRRSLFAKIIYFVPGSFSLISSGIGSRFSGSAGTGQPEKNGLIARNRPYIFRLNREKPELLNWNRPGNSGLNRGNRKNRSFSKEPPGNSRLIGGNRSFSTRTAQQFPA